MDTKECIIAPPLRGQWAIYNPPGHPKLAFDFLAVDDNKSPYSRGGFLKHLFSFISVDDTYTWSKSVYSPVDGEVIASHDGEKDRQRICFTYDLFRLLVNKPKEENGFGPFGGNHIVTKFGGHYLLLCHLKNGSLQVKRGDRVKTGDQIAEVGNSGSSIQPHLHIQVMTNRNYFPLFGNLAEFKLNLGKEKCGLDFVQRSDFKLTDRSHYLF